MTGDVSTWSASYTNTAVSGCPRSRQSSSSLENTAYEGANGRSEVAVNGMVLDALPPLSPLLVSLCGGLAGWG